MSSLSSACVELSEYIELTMSHTDDVDMTSGAIPHSYPQYRGREDEWLTVRRE